MASSVRQDTYIERLLRENDEVISRAEGLTRGLDERQIAWQPPEGGWSIGQVYEHMVVANESYLARIRALVAAPDARRAAADADWRPSLAGRLLVNSFRSPRKQRAPRMYRPAPQPRPNVVAAFVRQHRELARLLHAARGLDLRRIRTTSPVSAIIRLNLGDCFPILIVHAQRHLGQIERLRGRAGVPPARATA